MTRIPQVRHVRPAEEHDHTVVIRATVGELGRVSAPQPRGNVRAGAAVPCRIAHNPSLPAGGYGGSTNLSRAWHTVFVDYQQLADKITHCQTVIDCTEGKPGPCATIVSVQGDRGSLDNYHVPEPWSGHLDRAPLLFISSNPSISDDECFPTWDWPAERVRGHFFDRFDGGAGKVDDGRYPLAGVDEPPLHSVKKVAFWSETRCQARRLFGREPIPGTDYALTEVVHCKSRSNRGTKEALSYCSSLYLTSIMELAAARVVIVLGDLAREAVASALLGNRRLEDRELLYGVTVAGRERAVLALSQPGSGRTRRIDKVLSPAQVASLRALLTLP